MHQNLCFFNAKSSCSHFRNNVRYVEYTEFAEQSYDLIFLILWSAIIVCVNIFNINVVLTDMFITYNVSHSMCDLQAQYQFGKWRWYVAYM